MAHLYGRWPVVCSDGVSLRTMARRLLRWRISADDGSSSAQIRHCLRTMDHLCGAEGGKAKGGGPCGEPSASRSSAELAGRTGDQHSFGERLFGARTVRARHREADLDLVPLAPVGIVEALEGV